VRWLLKDWYRVEGGRNHLADFQKRGLTDLSLISGGVLQMGAWRIKIKLRYDYKLHSMSYIDDVK
jgi:hypothetical protein